MKKSLPILLTILIISSLALAYVPHASAATQDIKINNYTWYTDNLGYLVVIGEVQNTGTSVIKATTISGVVTESDGTVSESSCNVWGNYLLPGQKAPFYMEFMSQGQSSDPWTGVTASGITLAVKTAPDTKTDYQYQNIEVSNQRATPTGTGEYWVTADLRNNGTQTATDVVVVATFYNSEGKPVGAGYINPVDLSAGASKTIKVPAFDLNQTVVASDKIIKSWSLLIQVTSPLQTDGKYPTVSTSPVIDDGSNNGGNNGGNTNTNLGTDQNLIYAVIGIVAVVVVIAAVIAVKKHKTGTSEAEPETQTKPTKSANRKRRKQ